MSWFVVYTKPRLELQARDNLVNQNYQTFFPQVKMRKRRASGVAEVVEAMFPRYLFAWLEEGLDDFSKIRSTKGCVDLVKFGLKPQKVPEGFVEQLSQTLGDDHVLDLTQAKTSGLRQGQKVRLAEGAFEGLVGEIASLKPDGRVCLLLEVLGGQRRVIVHTDQVEGL